MASAECGRLGVVARHPSVELGLRAPQVLEDPAGEELLAKGAVEPLDLSGGGGTPAMGSTRTSLLMLL